MGKPHDYLIQNAHHFSQSPFIISSLTEFEKQLDDIEGARKDTKQLHLCFIGTSTRPPN